MWKVIQQRWKTMLRLALSKHEVRGHTCYKQPQRLELLHPWERHKVQHHICVSMLNSTWSCSRDLHRLFCHTCIIIKSLGNWAIYLLVNWLSPKENKPLISFQMEPVLKLEAQVYVAIDLGPMLSKDAEGQKHHLPWCFHFKERNYWIFKMVGSFFSV